MSAFYACDITEIIIFVSWKFTDKKAPSVRNSNFSEESPQNTGPQIDSDFIFNHKNYNFLASDRFKNVLFSTNSLAKLLSDSLLLDSLLLESLLSDSLISQSHSKM